MESFEAHRLGSNPARKVTGIRTTVHRAQEQHQGRVSDIAAGDPRDDRNEQARQPPEEKQTYPVAPDSSGSRRRSERPPKGNYEIRKQRDGNEAVMPLWRCQAPNPIEKSAEAEQPARRTRSLGEGKSGTGRAQLAPEVLPHIERRHVDGPPGLKDQDHFRKPASRCWTSSRQGLRIRFPLAMNNVPPDRRITRRGMSSASDDSRHPRNRRRVEAVRVAKPARTDPPHQSDPPRCFPFSRLANPPQFPESARLPDRMNNDPAPSTA